MLCSDFGGGNLPSFVFWLIMKLVSSIIQEDIVQQIRLNEKKNTRYMHIKVDSQKKKEKEKKKRKRKM